MRAFKQFPAIQVATSNLSKDAQKRLMWFDYLINKMFHLPVGILVFLVIRFICGRNDLIQDIFKV